MYKGVYCLVFKNAECFITIGALGEYHFSRGWYCYVGSALGPGGFTRVRRHWFLHKNHDKVPSWHVDYLLLNPDFHLSYIICGRTSQKKECSLARVIDRTSIEGFGASDCSCISHLFYRPSNPLKELKSAFQSIGLTPINKKIINDW